MKPDKDLEKSIYYDRKASVMWYCNHKIRYWFYKRLSSYYEERRKKRLLK